MAYTFEDAALCASVLGTLFYVDPNDDRCQNALAFALTPDAAAQWPTIDDRPTDEDASDKEGEANRPSSEHSNPPRIESAFALMRTNAETQEGTTGETLHETYARMLIGPNRLPAPPWGSVYTDRDSVIFGDKTLDVRNWMRENGVEMHLDSREPEDHFGLILNMFSWAARNNIPEAELKVLLEQHLLSWAPRFLELFRDGAQSTFYEGLACLASATLDQWIAAFDLQPAHCRLYR